MRRLDRRFRNNIYTNVKENQRRNSKGVNFTVKEKMEKMNKRTIIQYRESKCFGHIQTGCPNFLRKQNKGDNITFFNDETGEENEYDHENNVMEFTTRIRSNS